MTIEYPFNFEEMQIAMMEEFNSRRTVKSHARVFTDEFLSDPNGMFRTGIGDDISKPTYLDLGEVRSVLITAEEIMLLSGNRPPSVYKL